MNIIKHKLANFLLKIVKYLIPVGEVSDGYHTFNELYDHRVTLYLALVKQIYLRGKYDIYWSNKHANGEPGYPGWICISIKLNKMDDKDGINMMSYHIPESVFMMSGLYNKLRYTDNPFFNGHTAEDSIKFMNKHIIEQYNDSNKIYNQ